MTVKQVEPSIGAALSAVAVSAVWAWFLVSATGVVVLVPEPKSAVGCRCAVVMRVDRGYHLGTSEKAYTFQLDALTRIEGVPAGRGRIVVHCNGYSGYSKAVTVGRYDTTVMGIDLIRNDE